MSRRYFDQSERSNYDDSYRSGRSAVDISDKTPQFNNTSSANNSRYNGSDRSTSYMPSAYQQTVHEEYEDGYDDDPFGYDGDPLDDSGRTGTSQLTDATSGYGPQVSQYNNRGEQRSAYQSGINSHHNNNVTSSRGQLDSSGRMGRGNTYSNSTGTTSYGTSSYDTSYDASNQSSDRRTSNQSSSIDYHSMGGRDDQRSAYSYNNDNNTSMVDQSARLSNQQKSSRDSSQQQQYINQLHQQQYTNTGSSTANSVVSNISRRNTRESDISSVTSHQTQSQYTKQYSYGSDVSSLRTGGKNNLDTGKSQTPYQIEFNVTNTGKKITGTKRIIHFRFGFANSQALKEGKVGTDCRGDEHDIIIQWSITGGKRTINMDGREVQYQVGKRSSTSRRADVLEASWRIGNHTYDLKCYAYKPSNGSIEKRNPYWKQYSLLIDERSYFDLPQIFDLGERGAMYSDVPVSHSVESSNNDLGSRPVLNTRVAQRTNTLNQSTDVKNAIQNRIAQQRKLMEARKKEKQRVVPPQPSQEPTIGFETLSVDDSNRTGGVESSIFSAAPSELLDRSDRRPDYDPAQYETTDLLDESNRSSASEGADLFASAPSELEQARNRADQPPPSEAAPSQPLSNTGNEITPWVKQPTKPPPTKANNDWQPEPINNDGPNVSSGASTCSGQQRKWSQYHQQQQQKREQYQRQQQQAQQQTTAIERRRLPTQQHQHQGQQQDRRGSQALQPHISPMQRQKQQVAARAQDSRQQQATKNKPPQAPPSGSAPRAKPLQIEAGQRRESQLSAHRQIEAGHSSTSKPPTMDDIMKASSTSIGSGRSSRNKFAFF